MIVIMLEDVIRHATRLEGEYADVQPALRVLAASGDTALVPRLHEALARFLDEGNFYGRDLMAGILAGIHGVSALPVLLRASLRDLDDDQDTLTAEIICLLHADRDAARAVVLGFATSDVAEERELGGWALSHLAEPPR